MCLSHAGVSHEQESGLVAARIVTNEGLRKKLGPLQGFSLLRRISLTVGKIRDVTFKIAMLVALWNPRALHHARRALLHPAIAGHRHAAGCAIRPRHQLPTRPPAKRAILQRHIDSIRSRSAHGKLSALGNLWKELRILFRVTDYCQPSTQIYRITRGIARTIACRGVRSCVCEAATRDSSC